MDTLQKKALEFLGQHGMLCEIPVEELLRDFVTDMEAGLAGHKKSMLMIPTYMQIKDVLPVNEPVIAMDAGGTNFRIALVTLNADGATAIDGYAKYPMPGTKGRVTWQEFLDTVVDYMTPFLEKSEKVGFCFSFPTDILENKDGRLIGFNKEVKVDGSAGMLIGHSLNETLAKRGLAKKRFVLLNDTVAAMFSGLRGSTGKQYSEYIGLILGTGINTCYLEDVGNISRVAGCGGKMAVNMESGGWSGAPGGDYDRALDAASLNPGEYLYEKMVSGAYQGSLVLRVLQGAAKEGLLSTKCKTCLWEMENLPMWEVDNFYEQPFGDGTLAHMVCGSDRDRQMLYYLIEAILARAAKLVCVNVGGILLKTGQGTDPTRPACVVAEGTSFQKSRIFRSRLDYFVKSELNDRRGIYCEFVSVENATLIGTAAAGLMN